MGYLSESVDDFYLVDGVYRGREAAVDAKDLVIDDHGECEEVEHVGKVVPDICVPVFPGALSIETVGLRDTAGFVVAADEIDSVWVAQFEAYEQRNCFDREEATIDVITCARVC